MDTKTKTDSRQGFYHYFSPCLLSNLREEQMRKCDYCDDRADIVDNRTDRLWCAKCYIEQKTPHLKERYDEHRFKQVRKAN